MRRRAFLRMMAGGVAMALSPAFLNMTRLPDLEQPDVEGQVTLTIKRILADDTRETIDRIACGQLVDNGVNSYAEAPYSELHRKTFQIGTDSSPVTEIGVGGGGVQGGYQRFELNRPITVTADEELEVTYEYRVPS